MPGIEIKGRSKIANYRHGGRTGKFGGGRTNLLEQLGRVEAEPSNPNRRAEISRVHGELNRGYAKGGRAGFAHGSVAKVAKIAARKFRKPPGVFKIKGKKTHGKDVPTMAAEGGRIGKAIGGWMLKKPVQKLLEGIGGGSEGKPHSTRAGRIAAGTRKLKRLFGKPRRQRPSWKPHGGVGGPMVKAEGGRIGLKKGGNGKWMQKVSASIKKRGTKGKCTPITKPGCTGRAKALAKTFKKIAARRKG